MPDQNDVLDMIRTYSVAQTGTDEINDDIFKRDTVTEKAEASEPEPKLDEMGQPIVNDESSLPIYDANEIKTKSDGPILQDLTDTQTKEAAGSQIAELQRIERNLELSKARLGIKHLNIPTIYNSRVIDCASDIVTERAASKTDKILGELIEMFPDAVVEWLPGRGPNASAPKPVPEVEEQPVISEAKVSPDATEETVESAVEANGDDVKVIIDKRLAPELSFTTEELDRIKRSRSVEVQIVENRDLQYTIIDEPFNDIDKVLSQLTRKCNDRVVSLPASRYRCTLTGLSYPETVDLDYSLHLDTLEAEMKKWSIAYDHVKNPSIGKFEDFDDFLRKTSSKDINYILWGILCATAMSKEIVTLDCKYNNCGTTHEWVYSPDSLLQLDQIPEFLLSEMKATGEASSQAEIMDNYNGSMLRLGNVVELPSSKFVVGFGHISAYTYLNDGVFAGIREASLAESPELAALLEAEIMECIKYILLPASDGSGHYKITDHAKMKRIIHELDEMDFQVIGQIGAMMNEPYRLKFSIKDAVCPKCHHRTDIEIPDMIKLLFIIAQGLESANVVLKR